VAPSSSARKVAKLASRGKGKRVRFSGGTTFPAILVATLLAMVALVAYAKVSLPGEETGVPQPTDLWTMAYSIRVCDTDLPSLTGTAAETSKDASTGDETKVTTGTDRDGLIHYHAQAGGATGRKAKLGVFLDIYGVKLSDTKLELPASQVGTGETRVWDIKKDPFKGTSCEGKTPVIKVRVWKDYSSGAFVDNVTDFRNLRFLANGMAFAIAVVPDDKDLEIPKPTSVAKLAELGINVSAPTDTTVTGDTTGATTGDTTGDSTVGSTGDTTVTSTGDTTGATTTAAPTTTGAATTTTTG